MRLAYALAAAAMIGGAAASAPKPSPEQQLARLTKGAVPGKPSTCISLPLARESQTIDGLGVVYRIGRTYYLNRLGGDCALTSRDILITSTPSTQLCRGDIARIVDSAGRFPKGSCIFDDFMPYQVAK